MERTEWLVYRLETRCVCMVLHTRLRLRCGSSCGGLAEMQATKNEYSEQRHVRTHLLPQSDALIRYCISTVSWWKSTTER